MNQTRTTNEPDLAKFLESLQSEIDHLRAQNTDLAKLLEKEQTLVSHAQSLHLQTHKQIMPEPEEIKARKWWQI